MGLCDRVYTPGLIDILVTVLVSGGLATAAYWKGVLDLRGTVTGSVMGLVIGLCAGWEYVLLLLLYLITSFGVTRYGFAAKKAAGLAEGKKGERGWRSVLANGIVPSAIAVLFVFDLPGLDRGTLGLLFVTAIAAAAADTAASELGVLTRDPVLITRPRQRVEPGTNGGISSRGQLFALLAAGYSVVLGAFLFTISAGFLEGGSDVQWWVEHSFVLPLPVMMGFFSCQVDSVLGATLENAGHMGKNSVNLASISMTTVVTYLALVALVL